MRSLAPLMKYAASSNQMKNSAVTCGVPSGRTTVNPVWTSAMGSLRFIAVLDRRSRVVPRLQYPAKSLEVLGPALHEPVAIFLDLEAGLHHREQGPAVAS